MRKKLSIRRRAHAIIDFDSYTGCDPSTGYDSYTGCDSYTGYDPHSVQLRNSYSLGNSDFSSFDFRRHAREPGPCCFTCDRKRRRTTIVQQPVSKRICAKLRRVH